MNLFDNFIYTSYIDTKRNFSNHTLIREIRFLSIFLSLNILSFLFLLLDKNLILLIFKNKFFFLFLIFVLNFFINFILRKKYYLTENQLKLKLLGFNPIKRIILFCNLYSGLTISLFIYSVGANLYISFIFLFIPIIIQSFIKLVKEW